MPKASCKCSIHWAINIFYVSCDSMTFLYRSREVTWHGGGQLCKIWMFEGSRIAVWVVEFSENGGRGYRVWNWWCWQRWVRMKLMRILDRLQLLNDGLREIKSQLKGCLVWLLLMAQLLHSFVVNQIKLYLSLAPNTTIADFTVKCLLTSP